MGLPERSGKKITVLNILLRLLKSAITAIVSQILRSILFAKLEEETAPIRREYEYYEKCICDRGYFKETRILGAVGIFKKMYVAALATLEKYRELRKKPSNASVRFRPICFVQASQG